MGEKKQAEWHLTPRGWERQDDRPPYDRVLTMRCKETGVRMDCSEVWAVDSKDQIQSLLQAYGHGPNHRPQ